MGLTVANVKVMQSRALKRAAELDAADHGSLSRCTNEVLATALVERLLHHAETRPYPYDSGMGRSLSVGVMGQMGGWR